MPAEKAGLRKSDVVLKADGKPFGPVESFRGKDGQSVTLSIKRPALGSPGEMTLKVEVQSQRAPEMFLEGSRNSARIIESGGKRYGYFHLWTMASSDFRQALMDAVSGPLKDTDGFILDIRDGFGGRPEGFADPFIGRKRTRGSDKEEEEAIYTKPLVVLINEGSRSAKEVFTQSIKKSGRATVVGTNTAGHVLGTFPFKVSDWAYIEIPLVEVITGGVRLEKVGVAPDVLVNPQYDNGRDLVLSKGLEILAQKVNKKAA
jgi:carboxyl-terminal processing protease